MKKILLLNNIDGSDNNMVDNILSMIKKNDFEYILTREFDENLITASDLVIWLYSFAHEDDYMKIRAICYKLICLSYGYFPPKNDMLVSDFSNSAIFYRLPDKYEEYLDEELPILINGVLSWKHR